MPHLKVNAGNSVGFDRLRFDFTQPEPINQKQLKEVEVLVNNKISQGLNVNASIMTKDQAQEKGAMALFGEKYGDEVRVLEMGDFSVELCGGTHVENTKEIGIFKILSEASLSSGVRRIEAVVSKAATNYLIERSSEMSKLERLLSSNQSQVLDKVNSLLEDIKTKNKEINKLKDQLQAQASKDLFNNKIDIGKSFKFVPVHYEGGSPKELRSISDKFLDSNPNDVLFVYILDNDKASYLLRCGKSNKELHCSNLLKNNQEIINGKGGGKPDMAQGSGSSKNFDQLIKKIENDLRGN